MAEIGNHPQESADQELLDMLRLSLISGVGPRTRMAFLEQFGSPAAVLGAAPSRLRAVKGIGPKMLDKILKADDEVDAQAVIRLLPAKRH